MATTVYNPKARFLRRVLDGIPYSPNIVEIGSARTLEEDPTDGWSTVFLGRGAGFLWTVDSESIVRDIAYSLLQKYELPGQALCEDGTEFLAAWPVSDRIDFLYLDSSDDPQDTLAQAKAALPHMAQGSRIVIDDVQPIGENYFGKGQLAIPFLIQQGWKCLIEPTLWQGDNCWAMAKLWKD